MNDYGEVIKLPYESKNIYESLKKIFKYDKVKDVSLISLNEEDNLFILNVKRLFLNFKVTVKINKIEKKYSEIYVYSETWFPISLKLNIKNVKSIFKIVFEELNKLEKLKDEKDFEIKIINNKDSKKSFYNFVSVTFINFAVLITLFLLMNKNSTSPTKETWGYYVIALFLAPIFTLLYRMFRYFSYKRKCKIRKIRIKLMIYDLIEKEEKAKESEVNEVKESKITKEVIKKENIIINTKKINDYKVKGIDYVKRVKKEKPKLFWVITVSLGILILWSISKGLKDPCAFNVEMGGYHVTDISWCRTDKRINMVPEGYEGKVAVDDFVYCQYGTPDVSYGWAEGYVYKACAIKKGWK